MLRATLLGLLLIAGTAHAGPDTIIRFENGAEVRIAWNGPNAGIYYMPENHDAKAVKNYGAAQIHGLSTPPQSGSLENVNAAVNVRKGAAGEPVLVTINSTSMQAPNGKSTLAIFPDGNIVNYPIDTFKDATFGTSKAGDKYILGASFEKGAGNTKVFISPNPMPLREEGKIPDLAQTGVPGTVVMTRPNLVDWNAASVVATDAAQKNFDVRTGERPAGAKPGSNAVSLGTFREVRDAFVRKHAAVSSNGEPAVLPGTVEVAPPPPPVEAQRSAKIVAKGNRLVFKDAAGKEHAIAAEYDRAIADPEHGYLTATSNVEYKGKNYTLLKIFNTKEGNADGELFLIREDGEMLRFGFKSADVAAKVNDGILSLGGTERQIDLDRFDIETSKQSQRPAMLKDPMNAPLDPIAEVKNLFRDMAAESRRQTNPMKLLPTQEAFINNKLRPAAAQEGGSIAVYGNGGIGTHEAVQGFVDAYTHGAYPEIPRTWRALQLDVGALGSGTGLVGAAATREQAIVEFSREVPTFWIAPDFDGLKGVGSSSGDSSGSLSRLAPHIENGTMQMIALTTTPGFTASIATDPRMRGLFQPAEMFEAPKDEIVEALVRWMQRNKKAVPEKDTPAYAELEKSLRDVIDVSSQFDAMNGQPRKAERLLKTIYAQKKVKGEGPVVERKDIERGAINLYQADPSLFDAKLRAEKLSGMQEHLDGKLTGNTYAKKVAIQGYANVFTRVNGDKTPRNKALYAGPPGTGKSATVELSADYIKLPKAVLEMNNYVTPESLEQFLYDVASALRTNGYTILIFDEVEKAHKVVQAAALRMMQNGEFSARDSMEGKTSSRSNVQTSNASFQFTTNAAQDYVMDCYLGLKEYNEADFRKALVAGGISEPILDRIDEVVPVAPFSKKTFQLAIERAIAKFEKEYAATPEAQAAPLKLQNKEKFIADLVADNFAPDGKPKESPEGGHKLVNGRLVNRILKRYLKDPVSYQRSMATENKCIDVLLALEQTAVKVFD